MGKERGARSRVREGDELDEGLSLDVRFDDGILSLSLPVDLDFVLRSRSEDVIHVESGGLFRRRFFRSGHDFLSDGDLSLSDAIVRSVKNGGSMNSEPTSFMDLEGIIGTVGGDGIGHGIVESMVEFHDSKVLSLSFDFGSVLHSLHLSFSVIGSMRSVGVISKFSFVLESYSGGVSVSVVSVRVVRISSFDFGESENGLSGFERKDGIGSLLSPGVIMSLIVDGFFSIDSNRDEFISGMSVRHNSRVASIESGFDNSHFSVGSYREEGLGFGVIHFDLIDGEMSPSGSSSVSGVSSGEEDHFFERSEVSDLETISSIESSHRSNSNGVASSHMYFSGDSIISSQVPYEMVIERSGFSVVRREVPVVVVSIVDSQSGPHGMSALSVRVSGKVHIVETRSKNLNVSLVQLLVETFSQSVTLIYFLRIQTKTTPTRTSRIRRTTAGVKHRFFSAGHETIVTTHRDLELF